MKFLFLFLVLLVASVSPAQDGGEFKKPTTKVVKASTAPVTKAEARKVLDKAWSVLQKGLKLAGGSPVKLVADATPITKNEILAEFDLLVKASAASFKRSPRPSSFDAARFRADGNSTLISGLVIRGLVMPLGPLVTGQNGPVSTAEFGDAVGVLMARLADLCHTPSTRYSPNLMPG
jgi:hypothetical protein